ncbi:SERPINB [Lepeophtheirus salmonis]|uniref:SERPINB n=1 Tax=Lepeophtheirus salmonis TaxID=72036 RepID=A0A7R8H253_LEPSM|nr:SERPINB [Lepeophtheirus salmonis]CAF2807309.1 SERPINB [Lepeophtheirus salmonis]
MNESIPHMSHLVSIAHGSHKFGSELLLQTTTSEQNAVFSSYSISSVISMAALGARGNTLQQIKEALHLPEDMELLKSAYSDITSVTKSDDNITLEVANSVFPSKRLELREEYLSDVKKHFQSEIQSLDFNQAEEARKIMNDWVLQQTNGKVKELFAPGSINSDTGNVLVNAIYFKGGWLAKFDPINTTERDFFVSSEKTVKVPTMFASDIKYASTYNEDLKCTIAALPYKGERITMYLLVPEERFGLGELEQKFKLESFHDLGDACKSLGLKDMFDEKSDFSGMAGGPGELYVSKVVQKAIIEVNEEGSEAAAASGMVMMMRCAMIPQPLVIDHPFIFMIKDKSTGLVLFSGKVVDPSRS